MLFDALRPRRRSGSFTANPLGDPSQRSYYLSHWPPLLTNSNASCRSEKLTAIVPPHSIRSTTWKGRPAATGTAPNIACQRRSSRAGPDSMDAVKLDVPPPTLFGLRRGRLCLRVEPALLDRRVRRLRSTACSLSDSIRPAIFRTCRRYRCLVLGPPGPVRRLGGPRSWSAPRPRIPRRNHEAVARSIEWLQ
jgi:hypothetical protein